MLSERRKISAVHKQAILEFDRLLRLDQENQTRFPKNITKLQLEILTEAVFFYSFRAYENFLEDSFVLFTLGKKSLSGKKYKSFLKPKNFHHARELIQSDMSFLEWTSPDNVISRAELIFSDDGAPFKLPISSSRQSLRNMKVLRNHIAHNSRVSNEKYRKLITIYNNGVSPLNFPSPGKHLLSTVSRQNPTIYYLKKYIHDLQNVIEAVSR